MFGFGGGCGEHPMSVEEGWSFCEVGAGGCDRLSNDKRGSKSAEENMEMATESCSKKKKLTTTMGTRVFPVAMIHQ